MKESSKALLELISKECSNQLPHYKYNKHSLEISDKYRHGRVTALNYMLELTFFYFEMEKDLKEQLLQDLQKQMAFAASLRESDYKQGIYDAINKIIQEVEKN